MTEATAAGTAACTLMGAGVTCGVGGIAGGATATGVLATGAGALQALVATTQQQNANAARFTYESLVRHQPQHDDPGNETEKDDCEEQALLERFDPRGFVGVLHWRGWL